MTAIHDPHAGHVGFGSPGVALLKAKGRKGTGDGGGGGGRGGGGAVAAWTLELGQGWGHPAAVGVAQYQALLGTGLRGLGQGFLQVHLNGCFKKEKREREKDGHPVNPTGLSLEHTFGVGGVCRFYRHTRKAKNYITNHKVNTSKLSSYQWLTHQMSAS